MKRFFGQPLGHYVIVSAVSLCVSLVCFKLGGYLVEFSGEEPNCEAREQGSLSFRGSPTHNVLDRA